MSGILGKAVIVGVGLIGGSFALGLKQRGLVQQLVGYGRCPERLDKALACGLVDTVTTDMQTALADAELVMISVPMDAYAPLLRQMQPYLSKNTVVTDAGSVKGSVLAVVERIYGAGGLPNFVPGHPIAGREQSGPEAALADLFDQKKVILTPTKHTTADALEQVILLWQALGARVSEMPADYHDEVLAATSHLPHFLAYALVDMLNEHEELGNVFQYTAGGFRDFTRIASSDPTMWRDIAKHNQRAVRKWLVHFRSEMDHLIDQLDQENWSGLYAQFSSAKAARDQHLLSPETEDTASPNFNTAKLKKG